MTRTRNFNDRRRHYTVSTPTLEVDIVEDHAVLLDGLAVWLEQNTEGIRVVGRYRSWAELAARMDHLSDVVILDVLLGDNIPLPVKIRALLSDGPQVVVCSCVTDPAVIRQAYAAGALAYVPKTGPAAVIEAALRAAAAGQQYVPDEIAAVMATPEAAPQLTSREHQVVSIYLSADGRTMADVAQTLGITVDGVKKHLVAVRRKFQDGGEPLSRLALRQRLVSGGWLHD
ncbi:response regulator transcription factor [Arthrobacter sp. ISL-95]|uniref:response regulator transcription factor n=1 Tax=Arthrobacter sp. ISL-95 TaxID=2819116 RepID=UPI001BE670A1|nr:response regulator transcription factor [Arthrobacter sp. ISL-95]MBT2588412.1 response regulator transcription factor [Arthrobacter sp. ISL-95]